MMFRSALPPGPRSSTCNLVHGGGFATQPHCEPEDVECGLVASFCVRCGEEQEETPSNSTYETFSEEITYPLFHEESTDKIYFLNFL